MIGLSTRIKKIYRESGRIFKGFLSKHFKKNCIESLVKRGNYKSVPVYIISYNQLSYARRTVNWLKEKGYSNLTIIDNHSSYEPLLKYYDECGCRVIRMNKNYGHKVFYKCPRFWFARTFKFYCLTDPDLLPISDCPDDFVELFLHVMKNYPQMPKVGFSLKIDDIPDEYEKKEAVINWESKWYADEIEAGGVPASCITRSLTRPFPFMLQRSLLQICHTLSKEFGQAFPIKCDISPGM